MPIRIEIKCGPKMLKYRDYILSTIARMEDNDPMLFAFFCDCLRKNGVTYVRYRADKNRYLERQGNLFETKRPATGDLI